MTTETTANGTPSPAPIHVGRPAHTRASVLTVLRSTGRARKRLRSSKRAKASPKDVELLE